MRRRLLFFAVVTMFVLTTTVIVLMPRYIYMSFDRHQWILYSMLALIGYVSTILYAILYFKTYKNENK